MADMWNDIRREFPVLENKAHGHRLIYFDNAAMSQVPLCVIEAVSDHMSQANSNAHRGMHYLSTLSTRMVESARKKMLEFLGADDDYEIVFTSGTTHAVNMAASCLTPSLSGCGPVTVSILEHHSNLLPWRRAAAAAKKEINIVPCPKGEFDMGALRSMESGVIAVASVSNLTGTVFPLKDIGKEARRKKALLFIDGAQAARHSANDVKISGCDFYALSGHKMCGPTGTGVLLGRRDLLRTFDPFMTGGGTVSEVNESGQTYDDIPYRLEAGTLNIAGIAGLSAAAGFLCDIGRANIEKREKELTDLLEERIMCIEGIEITGKPAVRQGIVSFRAEGINSYDISQFLDRQGIAVRSGTHCAEPAVRSFGIKDTVRASVAFYNTFEEVDLFAKALRKTINLLSKYR